MVFTFLKMALSIENGICKNVFTIGQLPFTFQKWPLPLKMSLYLAEIKFTLIRKYFLFFTEMNFLLSHFVSTAGVTRKA